MSITLENSTNTIDFGTDAKLTRKGANALETPGSLDVVALAITGPGNGLKFPDQSLQTTAAVVPTNVSEFANDAGYLTSAPPPPIAYNNTMRYLVYSVAGHAAWVVATCTLFQNLAWTRSGTDLTINRVAHGHSVGDRVLARNTSSAFINALITAVTTDSYTIACPNSGATSGSSGLYGLGFNLAYNAATGSINAATLSPPSGAYAQDLQVISVRMHLVANTRTGTTFTLTMPTNLLTGLNGSTSMDDVCVPIQQVRQDGATLPAVGATIGTAIAGNYLSFQFAALPAATTGIHMLLTF